MDISDQLIKKVFERDIGKNVVSINKCEGIGLNSGNVFRVETNDGLFIFKIYRSADYPEKGKMELLASMFTEHAIPHARIYSCIRNDKYIPNGYIIEQYLPGIPADRLKLIS